MNVAWTADPNGLPALPGAYALLIALDRSAALPPSRFSGALAPGWYCYFGNARGPGGLRARCARHLHRDKPRRWHIDWLTAGAARLSVLALPGEHECRLCRRIREYAAVTVSVAGFGSSDCRRCPAHLIRIDVASSFSDAAALIAVRLGVQQGQGFARR